MSRKAEPRRAYDVVIVGAGPAGLGVACALQAAGVEDFLVVDRHGIGASFDRWPKETRLLTPSFPSNGFGMTDLNSIHPETSVAYTLGCEHPTGAEYAKYLRQVAEHWELPVRTGVDVHSVETHHNGDARFHLDTSKGPLQARYLVWAAGEFQYPSRPFEGADLCMPVGQVKAFHKVPGDEHAVIGGYESAVDAAMHLAAAGKRVTVVGREPAWGKRSAEPSISLSPFTQERLQDTLQQHKGRLRFRSAEVSSVTETKDGYRIKAGRRSFTTPKPPLLATGYDSSLALLQPLLGTQQPELDPDTDEVQDVPNLFLNGPFVQHGESPFCFIYKFRARAPVVAAAIATRLGRDPLEMVAAWEEAGMYVEDPTCCETQCAC